MPSSKGKSKAASSKAPAPAAKRKAAKTSLDRRDLLHRVLEEKRQQILARAAERNRVFEINAHGDLVDQSTDLSERELRMGMAELDRETMAAIDEALHKIEMGEYGVCASCGVEIPIERLMAIPTATLCVPCKEKFEAESQAVEETIDFFTQQSEE